MTTKQLPLAALQDALARRTGQQSTTTRRKQHMPDSQVIKPQPKGSTMSVRQDLAEEITVGADMSPTAAAAAAKAEIEARILAAHKWRRDIDQFRLAILKDCKRPGFAENALYHRPVGKKKNPQTGQWEEAFATNFSIRFIEDALQQLMNVHVVARIGYEDDTRALLTVQVIDVERNVGYSTDAMLEKIVERKEVKKGRTVRGVRENSYGDQVYLVDATKDEFRNVMGAERSKLIRDNGQRLLPRDILDECREQIERTVADASAKDPDAAKKKILDRFASLGISATMLKEYLGRPVETLTAKDIGDLAPLFNGLKEGDFTWADVMRSKSEAAEGEKTKTQKGTGETPEAPPKEA
jgi:hypothetical protein